MPHFKGSAMFNHKENGRCRNRLAHSIFFPQGIMHAIIFCLAILISFILINCLSAFYLDAVPPVTSSASTLYGWHGILELDAPVDNLILGDSSGFYNLITGPITDRLGGSSMNLGNNVGSSLLSDAWMLEKYMQLWGSPRNVFVARIVRGYEVPHSTEYMAIVPLDWGFWNNITPDWQNGEQIDLFIRKYLVTYSNSDVLSRRLLSPLTIFKQTVGKSIPSMKYSQGCDVPQASLDKILAKKSHRDYGPFQPCSDSDTALNYMCAQAEQRGFNLYIVAGPECDAIYADPARQTKLSGMYNYLAQYTRFKNVHVVPAEPVQFKWEAMQDPNHLRNGAERIYTEKIIDSITSLPDNSSRGDQTELVSARLDKYTYSAVGSYSDIPSMTVAVTDYGVGEINGAISCALFPSGSTPDDWVRRATAVSFHLGNDTRTAEVKLVLDKGTLPQPGKYDGVIYVRIDQGASCKERKFIIPDMADVTASGGNLYDWVEWGEGFSWIEGTPENNWRWCAAQGMLTINNPGNKERRVVIDAEFSTNYPELSNLIMENRLRNDYLRINNSPSRFTQEIIVPPGKLAIKFSCDARRVISLEDPRNMVFTIRNFHLYEKQ